MNATLSIDARLCYRFRWLGVVIWEIAVNSEPHPFAIEERIMADVPAWHTKGEWFDVCRCNVPCPCSWAQPPDDDYCDGVLVWHIREGRYGDVPLDGLNVVAFASFKGNIWEGAHSEPKMGVVMDERADKGQREALQMIFGGQTTCRG